MIEKICILGGGTAGFFTAAILSKYSKNYNLNLKIKCVYSSKIGIIGVGESTQININDAFKFLELKDTDWMKRCNATYKTNIAFESWSKFGEQFFYPFGLIDNQTDQFFELLMRFPEEIDKTQFARFYIPHSRFAELNRLSESGWNFNGLTSYHFDTHLLSKLLLEYCKDNEVEFVDDEYIGCSKTEKGIEYITCKNTGNHHSDLFVDCTGFKSLLLGKELNVPYQSYSDSLINHKALICKVPYNDKVNQLKNYTNNVTMENGWCWEIPLWDGMSLGYVHSLRFAEEKEIEQEFESFIKTRYNVEPENIRSLDFITGRYENGWVKNVVAVGLSYGFIEPLESTGILLSLNNIYRLVEIISTQKKVNSFDKKLFNYSVAFEMDRQKSFIDMHYATSHRLDTPYWNYVHNDIEYDWESLNGKHSLNMTILDRNYSNNFYAGLPFILTGNGYTPYNPGFINPNQNDSSFTLLKEQWIHLDKKLNKKYENFKSTYEFLKEKIYKD